MVNSNLMTVMPRKEEHQQMQFDPNLVTGQLLIWILNHHYKIYIAIVHIENDDIFVALSPLGLQPATEVKNS